MASIGSAATGNKVCDVFVIGGGPAGSTIAALLARRGKTVVLADKDRHPRFHIGESLLPYNVPLFDKLGVRDQIEAMGMAKYGIEFVSPDHEKPNLLDFGNGWHKEMNYSFQVRRSEFDHILLKNAQSEGAQVFEGMRVTNVEFHETGAAIAATGDDGEKHAWQARFVVDATGRDTFLANRMGLKARNPHHESASVYGHFENAERLAGREEGNISIFWFAKGWFWFIPLSDGTTSVGAVCKPETFKDRDGDVDALLRSLIDMCPALAERLRNATMIEKARATGNYSYDTKAMYGDRHILVGDASAFVDPVFSTGVYLAMNSAFLGADAVVECLDHPERAAAALKAFADEVERGRNRFTWFIYRITSPAIRQLFMAPRNVLRMQEAVLSLLAGDLDRKSPIRFRLNMFKCLYYVTTSFKRIGRALRRQPAKLASSAS
ncbi:MAG TPA: NAD(P)/FAD-dependent oxidoreductase [Stellaceae bacterium]|jgi:flavin-dependent dehydrogenase|nr:NAD(P)/FAD-dependent oxidoreductase [Stellaceae bacterium]